LREVGDQLTAMAASQSGGGVAVDVSRHLAETAAQAAKKLDGGVDATLADLKGFARRRPGLFLLGAIGAGFAAGRLIKAADSHAIIEAAKPDDGKPAVTPPLSFAPADQGNALALSAVGSADSRGEMS
jgi:hypothetical protein